MDAEPYASQKLIKKFMVCVPNGVLNVHLQIVSCGFRFTRASIDISIGLISYTYFKLSKIGKDA